MASIGVRGLRPLRGEVHIPGAKNSVLPIMAASLLCDGPVTLTGVPRLSDVQAGERILQYLGAQTHGEEDRLEILPAKEPGSGISKDLMRTMRSSLFYLAPLLVRTGKAQIFEPGGCNLGPRPIDMHLDGLQRMGAECTYEDGCYTLRAPQGLQGADIVLRLPSVGATETMVMAAVLAQGESVITGAACEPEVADLARFLNRCGAHIEGAGSHVIRVRPTARLGGCTHRLVGDRILASTVACAVAAAGGEVTLRDACYAHYSALCGALAKIGVRFAVHSEDCVTVSAPHPGSAAGSFSVETGPYPNFATDAGPLLAAAFLKGRARLRLQETIFENRFACTKEFQKLGARANVMERALTITGQPSLHGAQVEAKDLRGGAALIIAALAAQGETIIANRDFIDRGYEDIVGLFYSLGADIWEV